MHTSLRPLVYFAAPLFSEAELAFNVSLTADLERFVDVFLPQRDGGRVVDLVDRGVPIKSAYRSIFERDIEALGQADAVIAVLDGRAIDEGVALELGFAFAMRKTCVGYQSDVRRLLPLGNNPMIECALSFIATEREEILHWARCFAASPFRRSLHELA